MKCARARRAGRNVAEATFGAAAGVILLVGLTIWTIHARIIGEDDG